MAKLCSFCGRKLGFLDSCYSISGTDFTYCDRHDHFKDKIKNVLTQNIDADLSPVIADLQSSMQSVSEEFSPAIAAFIGIIKEEVQTKNTEKQFWEEATQEERIKQEALAEAKRKAAEEERVFSEKADCLMLTTGAHFDGYLVERYIDVLCEEIVFKNSFWKRLDAGFEDLGNALSFRDREMSGASELIANARAYVMNKFRLKAAKLGANAVLGVDFESSFGADVVRVSVSGTAVVIRKV